MTRSFIAMLLLSVSAPAAAQLAASDVNEGAENAFGVRIGVESVGLYSETSARGFSLQDAGNYRIEDAYFVRSAAPANPVLIGSETRLGVSALGSDFAGPSGVLNYRLRKPTGNTNLYVEAGRRANSGPFAEINFDTGSENADISLVGGAHFYPWQRYADGSRGNFFGFGVAPSWKISERVHLTGVATQTFWSTQADAGFVVASDRLPEPVSRNSYRGQEWTRFRNRSRVIGGIAEVDLSSSWRLRASAFESTSTTSRSDFNLFVIQQPQGTADVTALLVPRNSSKSRFGEVELAGTWRQNRLEHRLVLVGRARRTLNLVRSGQAVTLGRVNVYAVPPAFSDPGRPSEGSASRDEIDQWALGVGYRLSVGPWFEMRGDIQRMHYAKAASTTMGREMNVDRPWLYSASVLLGVSPKLAFFASTTKGLEESGTAPNNASNRNEVLPPVLATQKEVGIRYLLSDRLTFIGEVFEIRKDVPALRPDGVFTFAGTALHRGLELSIAGRVSDDLSVVLGGLYLEARLSGELVEQGLVGGLAVGRPKTQGVANVTWRVPGVNGLSVDAGLAHLGPEVVDRHNLLRTDGFSTMNVGMRYTFDAGGVPLTLRGRVVNVLNEKAWDATPSELLFPNPPRSAALSLTATI